MNVLQALTELYDSQNIDSIYRELAGKIMQNLSAMKKVTIYDIAELTSSSRTTIWRLVQKLGYHSFSDFRYALQSAASQYVYYNRMIDQAANASTKGTIDEVSRQLQNARKIYRQNASVPLVDSLISELHEATSVQFYLPFRLPSVQSLQQNLWKDGKSSDYCVLFPDMLEASAQLDEGSIVITSTIEFTETMDMTDVFESARKRKSKIWLFASSKSQYAPYADRHLFADTSAPAAWIYAYDSFLLTLSERYRAKYID